MSSVAKTVLFCLAQLVWGFPQTLAGLVMFALVPGDKSGRFRCAFVTRWSSSRGLSLGPFIFVPDPARAAPSARTSSVPRAERLLVHEYGHCIQSLIFGPLYLPLFAIPSMIWAGVPALERMRLSRAWSYHRFYTESSANWLGERVTGRESLRG